ncbi:glutamate--tRNA ligase [Candidatus Woesebacteria bacterium]|nr:glutamate--tRNA ligase [Candidatus Woesebacteria bacterium]
MNKTPIGPVVRTRMAPSPTGEYHVGHIATLLKNYAFAKRHGGQFVLRIEDTDQERKVEGAVEKILGVIRAYGLGWDEGPECDGPYAPYTQSERLPIYKEHVQKLLTAQKAYYCFCSKDRLEKMREEQVKQNKQPKYDGHCRHLSDTEVAEKLARGEEAVVRLKVPEGELVTFTDVIRGEITIASDQVDDQVLMKSDDFPTYHLAVVVDDNLMNITHVMRGEEWISSTPKHILLYKAFGWQCPIYAHIPIFLNPDGKGKMSKRKGTVAAQSFIDDGYLPEALLNFFMILGWTPEDQREILSLEEYIKEFDPADISAKSVVFDLDKLNWINGQYIRALSPEVLEQKIKPFLPADFPHEKLHELLPLVFERLVKLKDIEELTEFFYRPISHDKELLLKKSDAATVCIELEETMTHMQALEWNTPVLETEIRALQEKHEWKKSQYFMLLRVAVTGKTATPPLFDTLHCIGKKTVIERLHAALQLCRE